MSQHLRLQQSNIVIIHSNAYMLTDLKISAYLFMHYTNSIIVNVNCTYVFYSYIPSNLFYNYKHLA